jgi:hypothetical protein
VKENNVSVEDRLRRAMENGFPRGKDDAFDAFVGLFGMIEVVQGKRPAVEQREPPVTTVEGWMLGRSL